MANQPKKKNRPVEFEDVLAMYKFVKDLYARLDDVEKRLKLIEEWVIEHGATIRIDGK